MNSLNKIIARAAVALSVAALVQSCAMDAPFGDGVEANLTLTTDINSEVKSTRAISSEEMQALRENCIVYIENSRGVIRKYKGVDNIPQVIKLQTGQYVAEAWTGDSVSASFDSKFYRGYQRFEMVDGSNSLTLRCNIANVVVSVDPQSLDINMSDIKVTFSHSKGELVFTEDMFSTEKGYFMMPNADKDLSYKVEGKKLDGTAYVKTGKIMNVERAHEYSLKLTEDPQGVTEGGALIRITIADIPLYETEVEIFPAPAVRGVEYDIEDQIVSLDGTFTDMKVYVRGYFGLSSLTMSFSENFTDVASSVNALEASAIADLASKGVTVERTTSKDAAASVEGGEVDVDEVYITFSKAFLEGLAESDSEYAVTFEATDNQHKTGRGKLRIANTAAAVEHLAPVVPADAPDPNREPMAIGAKRATLTGYIYDAEAASNFGIKYRLQGTSEWSTAYPESSQSAAVRRALRHERNARVQGVPYTVTVTGLEPGSTYEYTSFCDGYDSNVVKTFTTESVFLIPNASFEEWSTHQASTLLGTRTVVLPGGTGDKLTSFWGSGNEGAATANKTLTNKSTDMVHSGTYSARLASDAALGVLAAGNIFIGHYAKTDGTNGELELGRPYNGSHPAKVRVYANYRPGIVDIMTNGMESFVDFVKGENDHGQIYIALADQAYYVKTKNQSQLFDPNNEHVLAYGQITWTENFGPDGALQVIEIPFTYNERAKTKRPTHLIITCCASKFGDFFSGSSKSVMYLDDFELVYE